MQLLQMKCGIWHLRALRQLKTQRVLIEGTIEAVNNGTDIANRTAQALVETVESAGTVVTYVDDISTSAAEQAESIFQVRQGVDQIAGIVQTNSATAEESAAASEELSAQAQTLKNLVEVFNLRKDSVYADNTYIFSSKICLSSDSLDKFCSHCRAVWKFSADFRKGVKGKTI